MKQQDLTSKIRKAAKAAGVEWTLTRQGANHEVWTCGTTAVAIPRHREINRFTAEGIMSTLDPELGEDWWR